MNQNTLTNLLFIFFVCLFWGLGGPISQFTTQSLSPSEVAFGRCLFAFIGLLPFLFKDGREIYKCLSPRGKRVLACSGLTLGIHFYFFVAGVAYASLATAVTLVAVEPVLILSVGFLIFNERLNRLHILGMISCVFGIFSISFLPYWVGIQEMRGSSRGYGDLCSILSVLSYAIYYAFNRSLKEDALVQNNPYSELRRGFAMASILYFFAVISSGVIWGLSVLIQRTQVQVPSAVTLLGLIALGLLPTIGGHTLSQIVSRRAHPIWVSVMSPGETVMALLIGYLFLNQTIGLYDAVGGIFILIGVGVAIKVEGMRAPKK